MVFLRRMSFSVCAGGLWETLGNPVVFNVLLVALLLVREQECVSVGQVWFATMFGDKLFGAKFCPSTYVVV